MTETSKFWCYNDDNDRKLEKKIKIYILNNKACRDTEIHCVSAEVSMSSTHRKIKFFSHPTDSNACVICATKLFSSNPKHNKTKQKEEKKPKPEKWMPRLKNAKKLLDSGLKENKSSSVNRLLKVENVFLNQIIHFFSSIFIMYSLKS